MSACQGTPWSDELDCKELYEAASWRVQSGVKSLEQGLHRGAQEREEVSDGLTLGNDCFFPLAVRGFREWLGTLR